MGAGTKWLLAGLGAATAVGAAWWGLGPRVEAPPLPTAVQITSSGPVDRSLELQRAKAAAERNPRSAALALEAGALAGEQGEYVQGLTWFERAARLDPELLAAITGQGQMWMALGRPGPAAAKYEQALVKAPQEPQLLLELARAYIALRDFPEALRVTRLAAEVAPTEPQAQRALALIYTEVLAPDQARAAAESACRLQPNEAENWATLGSVELRNNRYPAAELALKRALGIDPSHLAANLLYARVLTEGKKTPQAEEEAFAVLARVRILEPGSAQGMFQQAQILLRAGQLPLAISLLRQARQIAPRDSEILLALGQALGRTGRGEEGIRRTVQAQKLAPKGVSFIDLEELVARNPSPALRVRLADLYLRQDMHDAALRTLERGLRRAPSDSTLRGKAKSVREEIEKRDPRRAR